jgi:hypothetical protein
MSAGRSDLPWFDKLTTGLEKTVLRFLPSS